MMRFFGMPPGDNVDDFFCNRQELHHAGVHRPLQAGISGTRAEGADSIVVSGEYKNDEDHAHFIVYTGHGVVTQTFGASLRISPPKLLETPD